MSILEVRDLVKSFKIAGNAVRAIDGISFNVEKGQIVGLLGPNGAGKTTTIKCILGIMRPSSGVIRVNGFDPFAQPRHSMGNVAAVLEGSRNIYWRMSAWENIVFFAGIQGVSLKQGSTYFEHLLDVFRLRDKRDTEVRLMSQGMKQKVAIACALAKQTPLVFLDEPTLGLDVETSYELRDTLKDLVSSEGRTVIVSSHDMSVIQDVCPRVIIMSGGRIVADEQLENLLEIFRSRTYELIVAGSIDDNLTFNLGDRFGNVEIEPSDRQTIVRVNLPSAKELYTIVDLLREHNAQLESINQETPDLEKAFLAVVRKEREKCNAISQH